MRFLLLFVISEEVRKAGGGEEPTKLFLEQPADVEEACGALQPENSDLQPVRVRSTPNEADHSGRQSEA